jgi:hypothetical protein
MPKAALIISTYVSLIKTDLLTCLLQRGWKKKTSKFEYLLTLKSFVIHAVLTNIFCGKVHITWCFLVV